jgi:hypothetical protein
LGQAKGKEFFFDRIRLLAGSQYPEGPALTGHLDTGCEEGGQQLSEVWRLGTAMEGNLTTGGKTA